MKNDKQKDLPKIHRVVLSVLPEGRFNAITTKEIMVRTGIKEKRAVSGIISDLVEKYKQPIATTSRKEFKGVFIVKDIIDYQIGKEALTTRKNHLEKRDYSYTEACLEIFKGMVTLDEPKERRINRRRKSNV